MDEVTCVNKIHTNGKMDTFEYRDMYNDPKTVTYPSSWEMTVEQVEKDLNSKQ